MLKEMMPKAEQAPEARIAVITTAMQIMLAWEVVQGISQRKKGISGQRGLLPKYIAI